MEQKEKFIPVIIDTVTSDDFAKVKALRLESLRQEPQAFGRSYDEELDKDDDSWKKDFDRNFLDEPTEITVVARSGDELTGMMGAFPKGNDVWAIKAVYIKPKFRGRGISKQILEQMIDKIRSKEGVKIIELMVNKDQDAAVALYQKFGFEIVGEEKDQKMGDGNMYDEYIMHKTLDEK